MSRRVYADHLNTDDDDEVPADRSGETESTAKHLYEVWSGMPYHLTEAQLNPYKHLVDPVTRRFWCKPGRPMPAGAEGKWIHWLVRDGRCRDCGVEEVLETMDLKAQ